VPPFRGGTPVDVLLKHALSPPLPLREQAPELALPGGLCRLVERCLEKAPAERPQTMREVLSALCDPALLD
jgi:hypothetical protein